MGKGSSGLDVRMLKLAFKPVLHEDCLRQGLSGATDQVLVVVASVMMKHEETGAQGSEEYCAHAEERHLARQQRWHQQGVPAPPGAEIRHDVLPESLRPLVRWGRHGRGRI